MKSLLNKAKLLPFTLCLGIILLDQLTKAWIVRNWPQQGTLIKDVFENGFLQIYHVRNKAIAFSLGYNLPEQIKPVLFIILPLIVLGLLVLYYFKSPDFTRLQRWATAGVIGGGLGNIIDRIFRPDGVVDFISVKFYGIFGWERWPTFNFADSSVVICCLILLASMFFSSEKEAKHEQKN